MHFSSFVPVQYKRGLVQTLYARARKVCTEDTIDEELRKLAAIFKTNGYPASFVKKFSQPKPPNEVRLTAEKCPVYLRLPFKGDDVSQTFKQRLSTAVQRTFCAAKPVVIFSCNRIPAPPIELPLAQSAKANIIYQFQCGQCQSTHHGRTAG